MRAKLMVFALSTCLAFGQDVARVFHLHHVDTERDLKEFATLIRTVADLPKLSADSAQETLSASGTPAQIAVGEWLFNELDRQTLPEFETKEFKVPNKEDDVVRVFFLRNTATVQQFQEVATLIRTVEEIRRVFTYNTPRAVVVRGAAVQLAAAGWMIHELGKPVSTETEASEEYPMPDIDRRHETVLRVFYVKGAATEMAFQQVATQIRTTAKMRRVFTYSATRAIALCGTAEQVAIAEQMLKDRALQIASK